MSKRPNWRKGVSEQSSSTDIVSKLTGFSNDAQNTDPQKSTLYVFHYTAIEFAKKLQEWYPDFEQAKKYIEENDNADEEFCSQNALTFHSIFQSATKAVLEKDVSFWNHDALKEYNANEKFSSLSDDKKDEVWKYFHDLIQYSSMVEMYNRLPNGMLNSISNMAGGLMNKFQKGEMDMNSLNPLEIGQMLMKDINQEELESFGKSLIEGGNLENMMAMMQNTLGSSNMNGLMDILKK